MRIAIGIGLASVVLWVVPCSAQENFRRGDANVDGKVDIADLPAIFLAPSCEDAADADDRDFFDSAGDWIRIANYLFLGTGVIPPPGPDVPGPDPTPDSNSCTSYLPSPPPKLVDLALGFQCPNSLAQAPGASTKFEALATLTTTNNTAGKGASAWSIGIVAEGASIIAITTRGTDVDRYGRGGFLWSQVTAGAGNEGAISAIYLDDGSGSGSGSGRLPAEGNHVIAKLLVEVPAGVSEVVLRYRDGLRGSGQPVPNVVALTGTSQVPELGSCRVVIGDCNGNGVQDRIEISTGASRDCDSNGILDECDPDCNGNGTSDMCEMATGSTADCNGNGVPDSCDLASASSVDQNSSGIPDECEDCNLNGRLDDEDIGTGSSLDCNANGIPDECDLEPHTRFSLPQPHYWPMGRYVDVDADGDLDVIAVVNSGGGGAIQMFQNTGGTFAAPVQYDVGYVQSLFIVDVDGVNGPDLIVYSEGMGITLLANSGGGTFTVLPIDGSGYFGVPRVADIDGDGDGDLIGVHSQDVQGLFRDGSKYAKKLLFTAATRVASVEPADIDGDRDIDLVLGSAAGSVITVLNDGRGAFASPSTIGLGEFGSSGGVFVGVGDLNGDGAVDVVASVPDRGNVHVLLNAGEGNLAKTAKHALSAQELSLVDMDRDGDLDIVSLSSGYSQTGLLLNGGAGDMKGPILPVGLPEGQATFLVDFDQDGLPDLGAFRWYGELAVLLNETRAPFSADSNGTGIPDDCESPLFHRGDPNANGAADISDAIHTFGYLFLGGNEPSCLESADVNNSGDVDISDGIYLLQFLFGGGAPPVEPGPPTSACGADPDVPGSDGDLGCSSYTSC